MTQHIKTHFKPRGINSLANNPQTLANFLSDHKNILTNYDIPENILNTMATEQGFVIDNEDNDTNRYDEEIKDDERKDEFHDEIDPC